MTTTPECWDDVGSMRLQVDCHSLKIDDINLAVNDVEKRYGLEIQDLKEELVLLKKKERCLMKIGITIVCACVIVLLVLIVPLMMYFGSAPGLTQMVSDKVWKTHFDSFQASAAVSAVNTPAPPVQVSKGKHSSIGMDSNEVEMKLLNSSATKQEENDAQKAAKREPRISHYGKATQDKEMNAKQTPRIEVHGTPYESLAASDAESVTKSTETERIDITAKDAEPEGEGKVDQQIRAKPVSWAVDRNKQFNFASYGVVWVCFPTGKHRGSIEKYASVVSTQVYEVVRSQKWMVFPFCYIVPTSTTRTGQSSYGEINHERFCDDPTKMTFVAQMEKSTSNAYKEIPSFGMFDECAKAFEKSPEWFDMQSPDWFTRTFPPEKDLQASVVEEFLHDVYSSKLLGVTAPKEL